MNTEGVAQEGRKLAGGTWRPVAGQLYEGTLPLVVLLLALLIFPSRLTPVGLVGALALFGLRWFALGHPFPALRIALPLLVLLGTFALGLVLTPRPDTAWMVASHLMGGMVALVTLSDYARTPDRVTGAIGLTVLAAALFALGAPFAVTWGGGKVLNLNELVGSLPLLARPSNANNVAGALETAVPLALALVAAGRAPWRTLGAVALAPLAVMLILLQSRGAWLAVLMGLVVYATLYRRWVLPFVPLVLLGGLWLNGAVGSAAPTTRAAPSAEQVVTLGDRTEVWSEAARLIAHAPLTGIGVNGFAVYGAPVIGEGTGLYPLVGSHAHNLVLEVALDTGVVGAAALVVILAIAVRSAWRVYRRAERGSTGRALAIGLLAMFAVIATHGMFDTVFWGFKAGLFMWAGVALALALERSMMTRKG